jgi:hypothetical protein
VLNGDSVHSSPGETIWDTEAHIATSYSVNSINQNCTVIDILILQVELTYQKYRESYNY